ncbi:hypothetical protein [Asticcacaulis benevestitus]|uniref:Uncharacterized protein n=1 Tax=Asticcacaulis benevestitus DSM 16100 = ATCC BAA-896 TaxID=1121022 RepID=V4PVZ9_9CAUL|nr:hypothetical protein [Asticcacaulis benevestitus]ESQ89755.1 hypothetical protein ABENE_13505 [Asticcacaulis benevestitus DSM 16100 = ATCC BAA-896]
MNDTPEKPAAQRTQRTHAEIKAERLQAALRENLRRRKAANAPASVSSTGSDGDIAEKPVQNDV